MSGIMGFELGVDRIRTDVISPGLRIQCTPFFSFSVFETVTAIGPWGLIRPTGAVAVSSRALLLQIYHRFSPASTTSTLSLSLPCSSTMKAFASLPISVFSLFVALLLVPRTIAGEPRIVITHLQGLSAHSFFRQRISISKNPKPEGNGKTVQRTPSSGRRGFWTTSPLSILRLVDSPSTGFSSSRSMVCSVPFIHFSPPLTHTAPFLLVTYSTRNVHRSKHLLPGCSNWR